MPLTLFGAIDDLVYPKYAVVASKCHICPVLSELNDPYSVVAALNLLSHNEIYKLYILLKRWAYLQPSSS